MPPRTDVRGSPLRRRHAPHGLPGGVYDNSLYGFRWNGFAKSAGISTLNLSANVADEINDGQNTDDGAVGRSMSVLSIPILLATSNLGNGWSDAAFDVAAFSILIAIGVASRNPNWILAGGAWALLGGVFAGIVGHAPKVAAAGVLGLVAAGVALNLLRQRLSDPSSRRGSGPNDEGPLP